MTEQQLTPGTPQWDAAWDALRDAAGSYEDLNPDSNERWQYMGTFDGRHQFRHRHRPKSVDGRVLPPITGFAGEHIDRIYLHMDAETLRVMRVSVRRYLDDVVSMYAGHTHGEGRPVRKSGGTSDTYGTQFDARDCSGVFDGFSVTSDADPGL